MVIIAQAKTWVCFNSEGVKSLHDKESLTDILYKKISPVSCRPVILYGQVKVQKPVINRGLRNGVLFVLACMARMACLHGWYASVGGVGGVLA